MPRFRDVDRLFRRFRLEQRLRDHLPRDLGLTLRIDWERGDERDHWFWIEREGRCLVLSFDYKSVLWQDHNFRIFRQRAGAIVNLMAQVGPGVRRACAEISDGSESEDGWICFCSRRERPILVPDSDFYSRRGYADFRGSAATAPRWEDRSAGFVWRGSTTGHGRITDPEMEAGNPALIQRTRVGLALRGITDADVRFSRVGQTADIEGTTARLRSAGLLGESLDTATWQTRRFAFDLDGNSNAWSNLFIRLLQGCCVIKVASPEGYRQWYYDQLRPFEHFVPVAADLSDLHRQLEWCRGHSGECARIAAAGQALALGMTYEGEMSRAVERVTQALGGVTAAAVPRTKAM